MSAAGTTYARRRTAPRWLGPALLHLLLLAFSAACLVPFLWMISTSFKRQTDVFSFSASLLPHPFVTTAYSKLIHTAPIVRWFLNSLLYAGTVTAGQLVISTIAAYAFAQMRFKGRDTVFFIYLGTMMVPFQVTLVPLYIMMKDFGWIDTYYALIVPNILGSAFGTFLIRQYFMTLPRDLIDAARVDGAGHARILFLIAAPLAKPAMATVSVFAFIFFWSDFMWPLIVTNSEKNMTLTVGVANLSHSQPAFATDWPTLMAGTVVAIVPMLIVFLFAQKYFIRGITLTGIKG